MNRWMRLSGEADSMTKRAKILLVDDDEDFVEAIKTVLESKPYEVLVARNGDEGLHRAREDEPDLILLDIIMPAKDGFTVAKYLKDSPELGRIPVLMLTSFSQRRGEMSIPVGRGYSLETEDYIEKPVEPEILLATIEEHLRRAGLSDQSRVRAAASRGGSERIGGG